ncbi:hypothetical protein HPP92_018298 [Vanilla planifolia]|uniref:Uncharacterized protein n=1 Tax=Vanilla planifolia TaxID=51239 RepID=A0A835UQH5_VANPL|nr:hypothetical protein HPP92_018298 [Vanilla planifolia]
MDSEHLWNQIGVQTDSGPKAFGSLRRLQPPPAAPSARSRRPNQTGLNDEQNQRPSPAGLVDPHNHATRRPRRPHQPAPR